MDAPQKFAVDEAKIKTAVMNGFPLTITTYTLPHEMEVYMGEVLAVFLRELHQEQLTHSLVYCLNELVINAKKANTKRVYFQEKHLSITDPADYEKGMRTFKGDTLGNLDHYLELQKAQGLFVKLVLQARNRKIMIEVRNNVNLTVFEYKRMHDKLSRAQQYVSTEDALPEPLDDSEGAGLGLVILILILKKVGLTEENFRILSQNGQTVTRLILPVNERALSDLGALSDELVERIDTLPQFSANILEVNRLLSDPEAKLADIAAFISTDVALAGDLLKIVNSAAFALATPCMSIAGAVKMVGTRGIRNLLYSLGTMQSLGTSSPKAVDMWDHANMAAFFAYNLARNYFAADKLLVEDSYVCGLLHDMGKLILDTTDKNMFNKFLEICAKKKIPVQLVEALAEGANHAEIGAKIAEKWNFPPMITNVIRYHHEPSLAPEDFKRAAYVVAFANLLCHYQAGEIEYYQFDPKLLALFRVSSEEQLKTLSEKLAVAFAASRR